MSKIRALALAGLLTLGVSHHSNAIAPLAAVPIALNVISGGTVSAVGVAGATASVGAFIKGFTILTAAAAGLTWFLGGYDSSPSQVGSTDGSVYDTSYTGTYNLQVFEAYAGPEQCKPSFGDVDVWKLLEANISGTFDPASRPVASQVYGTIFCNQGQVTITRSYRAVPTNGDPIHYGSGVPLPTYNPTINDSTVELNPSNGQFSFNTDPDIPANVGGESGVPIVDQSGRIVVASTNSQNQFVVNTVSSLPDGGTMLSEYVQTAPNQVSSTQVQVSPSGQISNVSTTQTTGTVNPAPTTLGASYSPVTAPTPTNQGQFDPATGEITFPSDYARAGEAAAAAQTISENLLQGEVVTPVVADADMPWFGDTFQPLSAFQINTTGATCPVWQFDALDENFYIDHHCTLIQDFNALFYAMFTAFWVLLAIRTVMEA